MFNAGQNNSENPVVPISELEIVTGFVFNKSGVQTRRQRDTSAKLKDEFDRISRWVEAVICRRPMQQKNEINSDDEKGNDNDHKKDDAADQDEDMGSSNSSSNGGQATTRIAETTASKTAMTSPLELAMACLDVGSRDYTSQQGPWRFGSDFQSFKVVAAHCSLKELDAALERAQRQQLDDESAPDEGL